MKRIVRLFAIASISAFWTLEAASQCVPDTVNCVDTGDPGQICPSELPDVTVNVPYDTAITVLAPATFDLEGGGTINIIYIVVDSVLNLPPGIDYLASADKFYPDSAYCIQIFGTPVEPGDFPLFIYVTPFVSFMNDTISGGQVVDSTSVIMTVLGTSGFDPYQADEFRVLPNVPNPFSDITRIGFFTPFDARIELQVYNILGELLHEETQGAPPGEHFFRFDGSDLIPGTYFYRVTNSSSFHTGKLIKTR